MKKTRTLYICTTTTCYVYVHKNCTWKVFQSHSFKKLFPSNDEKNYYLQIKNPSHHHSLTYRFHSNNHIWNTMSKKKSTISPLWTTGEDFNCKEISSKLLLDLAWMSTRSTIEDYYANNPKFMLNLVQDHGAWTQKDLCVSSCKQKKNIVMYFTSSLAKK